MKINLLFSKKKDDKLNGELHKKKEITNVFSISDDEEPFVFESNQNKKIEEKEKRRIEEEIKEFVNEHEHSSEETRRRKEAEKKEKEKSKRKKIVYLGYKGNELTKIKQGEKEHVKEKDHNEGLEEQEQQDERDWQSSQGSSFSKRKEGQRKEIQKQKELRKSDKKRESKYKNKSRSCNRENEKKLVKHSCDGLPNEQFVDPRRKEVNVDEIFGKKEEVKDNEKNPKTEKPKSQYMDALIHSAKRRKLEKEMLIQKKLKVDTEKKEKVFITSAYKKIMMDRELIKQEILKEEEEKAREKKGAKRNLNLSTFYKNINAPSNYDRSNRRPYSSDRSTDSDY